MAYVAFPDHAKSFTTPSNITYSYVHIPRPQDSDKPTILFLHGFPSSSYDWHHQISHFGRLGYNVIAPDLLGYGGTDAPTSLEPYKFKNMAADMIALLKHTGVALDKGEKIHLVGHDFGSIFLGPFVGYYPAIARSCAFVAVAYSPPGKKLHLDQWKEITEKELGFELFGYRRLFIKPDSWKLLGEHKDSFFSLIYGPEEDMFKHFFPAGELEAWLRADRKLPLRAWVTEEYKRTRDKIFESEDAYRGPLTWYKARFDEFVGIDEEAKEIPNPRLPCPTLFMQSGGSKMLTKEMVARTGLFADDYEYREAKGGEGHWVQLEVPDEVNAILDDWFARK